MQNTTSKPAIKLSPDDIIKACEHLPSGTQSGIIEVMLKNMLIQTIQYGTQEMRTDTEELFEEIGKQANACRLAIRGYQKPNKELF